MVVSPGVRCNVERVGGPRKLLGNCGNPSGTFEGRRKFACIGRGCLEVFQLNVDELIDCCVFVGVSDDEFRVAEWLLKCGELRLELVHLANCCHCFVKVGDFWKSVHIPFDFADDLGVECSLTL